MNWRPFVSLLSFVIVSVFFGITAWVTESQMVMWGATAIAFAILSVGLGVNSFMIALGTDRKMNKMNITLKQLADFQEEIRKEQREQSSSGSTIVPTLQAFSQLYLDYLAKQKSKEEQQNVRNNEGSSKEA